MGLVRIENSEIYTKIVKINKTFLSRYGIINHSIKIRRGNERVWMWYTCYMNRCGNFSEGYKRIYLYFIFSGKCDIRKDGSILRYSDEKGGDGYGESV